MNKNYRDLRLTSEVALGLNDSTLLQQDDIRPNRSSLIEWPE